MKNFKLLILLSLVLSSLSAFAETPNPVYSRADSIIGPIIEKLARRYAPDKRTAVFQIEVNRQNNQVTLSGKTNQIKAKNQLIDQLRGLKFEVNDQIKTLPEAELGERIYGLVEVSVCNIRSAPRHSGELATQALMGTPLKVLEMEDNGWLLVQTPDQYIAWVDRGAVTRITKEEFDRWKSAAKIIYTNPYGFSYVETNTESQTVSDLVYGDVLEILGEKGDFYQVLFADARKGYVLKSEAKIYSDWIKNTNPTEESLVRASKRLMGIPYLWGGTSFKGVDCSGFTKTVYFMNGLILPRDASQQVFTGDLVDKSSHFESLEPGDLLFFGEKREDGSEKVVHVGMWIGNDEFIHASDKVRIGSVNPKAANFDEYNVKRYLRSKRILKSSLQGITVLKENNIY